MRLRFFCGANLDWLMFEPKSHKQNRSKCWCRTSEIGDRSGDWIIECALLMPPQIQSWNWIWWRTSTVCVFEGQLFCNKDSMSWKGDTPFFLILEALLSFQRVGDNAWICDFFCCENCNVWIFFAALLTKKSRKVYIYLEIWNIYSIEMVVAIGWLNIFSIELVFTIGFLDD